MPTQLEYNLSKQRVRLNSVKINLLNYKFQNVGELSGDLTTAPKFTIEADSDIRRTCNISLTPRDSSFDIKMGNKIWLDKYIQVFIGQQSAITKQIEYTNMGIYLINNPQRTYSATENTLTFQGIDLMARLTGLRNGSLQGLSYIIPQGSNVRRAIVSVLEMCGFNKYVVDECSVDVPNDINIAVGGTAYDILKQLRDILPNYQMYFDVDGVFHYNLTPSGKNEQIMVDDDIWKPNLISYKKDTDFESLKNSVEVYGKTHTVKNYGGNATALDDTYSISLTTLSELTKGAQIGFNSSVNLLGTKYLSVTTTKKTVNADGTINSQTLTYKYPIKDDSGSSPTFNSEDTYYVVKLNYGEDQWDIITTQIGADIKTSELVDNVYVVQDSNVYAYNNNMVCTFRTPMSGCDEVYSPYLQINGLDKIVINNTVKLRNNTVYTIKLKLVTQDESQRYFYFMGEVTPYAKVQETNPNSPFYIGGTMGEVRIVLSGGEYDNIYTSNLAKKRAEWELYKRCRLEDSVTIDCIPIYWLDVNWLVSLTLPNKYGEETTELYLIKSISTDSTVGGTQSITLMKYYPYYE